MFTDSDTIAARIAVMDRFRKEATETEAQYVSRVDPIAAWVISGTHDAPQVVTPVLDAPVETDAGA